MATKIIPKKSTVAAKVPLGTDLEIGEIAINLTDRKLYSKNASGDVVEIGGAGASFDQDLNTTDDVTFNSIDTGNILVSGTVDGRDIAADGIKLDGIEAGADVTDTANVTAAGALMDSEVTNLAAVKAFDPTDYATAAQGSLADSALQSSDIGVSVQAYNNNTVIDASYVHTDNNYTTTEKNKLAGIETGATADQTITAGDGLTGGGTGDVTISHADTSSQASVNNSNGNVIQDVTLDTYGHVTGLTSVDLDGRYYTETEADSRFVNVTGDTMTGDLKTTNIQLSSTTPTIWFNGTADGGDGASSDMAIKATPEGLDFFEPEDANKIHFQILDDAGVNAPFGYKVGSTQVIDSSGKVKKSPTLTLSGDASGSATFTDLGNATLNVTVANDSHSHSNYVAKTGDTMTGLLTLYKDAASPTLLTLHNYQSDISGAGNSQGNFIDFKMTDNNATYTPQVRIGMIVNDYSGDGGILSEGMGNFVVYTSQGTDTSGNGILNERFRVTEDGRLLSNVSDRVFTDGYHPNADKWTTPRTLSLSGDASGSVSWDGSSNATLSVTVANDSHSHSNYVAKTGDTMTGNLTMNGAIVKSNLNTVNATTTSTTINFTASNFHVINMSSNTTFTFSNLSSAISSSGTLVIKQDATGGRSFTLPSVAKTPVGGASIVQSTGANTTSILSYLVVSSTEVLVNYVGDFA